jgi:hypothetical protein
MLMVSIPRIIGHQRPARYSGKPAIRAARSPSLPGSMTADLQLMEAALFTSAPTVGSTDCTHEAMYVGYRRVPLIADDETNLTEIVFTASEQDAAVLVTHAAAIDGMGVIRAVHAL